MYPSAERINPGFHPSETRNETSVFVVAGRLRRVGFIFPCIGDVSQATRQLYGSSSAFRDCYDRAREILGYSVAEFVIGGPEEHSKRLLFQDLGRYIYNQADHAVYAQSPGYQSPELVTGQGVGFVNALVLAGSVSFEDGVQMVVRRADAMDPLNRAVMPYMGFLAQLEEEGRIKPAYVQVVALTNGRLIQEPGEITGELKAQLTKKEAWDEVLRTLRKRRIRFPLEIGASGAWSKMRANPQETAIVAAVAVSTAGFIGLAWRLHRRRRRR